MALINKLNNLADAVRTRAGISDEMTLDQMADVVRNIPQPDLSAYATTEYVDEKISGIEVEVDGVTILKDSRGQIYTALGGGRTTTIVNFPKTKWEGTAEPDIIVPCDSTLIKNYQLLKRLDPIVPRMSVYMDDTDITMLDCRFETTNTGYYINLEKYAPDSGIEGIVINEDEFTIQFVGATGTITEFVMDSFEYEDTSVEYIDPDYINLGDGLRNRSGSRIEVDTLWLEEQIETYLTENYPAAEEVSV